MSETSTPPPSSPAPRPRRPWTILGRLSKAVREQNWFAVVLELAIVVLGVVIGFQVTAWGQSQADRVKERAYLRQLAKDLRATEHEIAEANAWLLPRETAAGDVLRSFYDPAPLHPDTLRARIVDSLGWYDITAVTGAAEALVATGDLSLIREDSLRAAITFYLKEVSDQTVRQYDGNRDLKEPSRTLQFERDPSGWWDLRIVQRGVLLPGDPLSPFPPGPRRSTTRVLNVEAFRSDPVMEVAASDLVRIKLLLRESRERLLAATVALREQVEAELNR